MSRDRGPCSDGPTRRTKGGRGVSAERGKRVSLQRLAVSPLHVYKAFIGEGGGKKILGFTRRGGRLEAADDEGKEGLFWRWPQGSNFVSLQSPSPFPFLPPDIRRPPKEGDVLDEGDVKCSLHPFSSCYILL